MFTLAIPAYFHPVREGDMLTGEAKRAPLGIPCEVMERRTHGKGKNKFTRVLVQTAAPAGWGEWSGRAWYAWVEQDAVR